MAVRLSKRMGALAQMVTAGNRLCDVGCDHGFLPIFLVQQGVIPSAIAMDINEGPLAAAREHIAAYGLQQQITTRLSDGLSGIKEQETDTILIAGMGGALVIHILTEGRKVAQSAKELILQPQSEVAQVRRFLWQEGYDILAEDMVVEDGKYYPMMKVSFASTNRQQEAPTEAAFLFGPLLLRQRHSVLQEYLLREQKIQREVLGRLQAQEQTDAIALREREIRAYLKEIDGCLAQGG